MIAVFDSSYPLEAEIEVEDVFSLVQTKGSFLAQDTPGVYRLRTEEDPREVVSRLAFLYNIQEEKFRYTRRWVPIDRWVQHGDIITNINMLTSSQETDPRIILEKENSYAGNLGDLVASLSGFLGNAIFGAVDSGRFIYLHLMTNDAALSLLRGNEILYLDGRPLGSDNMNRIRVG